jgi:uncharacterized DUF497 family protein
MDVEFDVIKARSNLSKHGVSFEEAISALHADRSIWVEDPDSETENRWIFWSFGSRGRLLCVVVTIRGDRARIISARKATKAEAKFYAQRI